MMMAPGEPVYASEQDRIRGAFVKHCPELDGLRGVAISMVLIEHAGGLLAVPFDFGYYGVELFFVLSGFLITGILLQAREKYSIELWRFIWRRAFRIFPLYYACLALFVLFDYGSARSHFPWLVSYTWNYWCAFNTPVSNPLFYLWSLSVEEQFYVVWPFVVLGLRDRRLVLLHFSLGLIVFGYAQQMYHIVPWMTPMNYTGLPSRMGALCLGAVAAIVKPGPAFGRLVLGSRVLEGAAVVGIFWGMGVLRSHEVAVVPALVPLALPAMALGSVLLIGKCAGGQLKTVVLRSLLNNTAVRRLGTLSYCVYLIHTPVIHLLSLVFDPIWLSLPFPEAGLLRVLRYNAWIIKLPLVTIGSVCIALISARLFEDPLRRLRERLFPRESAVAMAGEQR